MGDPESVNHWLNRKTAGRRLTEFERVKFVPCVRLVFGLFYALKRRIVVAEKASAAVQSIERVELGLSSSDMSSDMPYTGADRENVKRMEARTGTESYSGRRISTDGKNSLRRGSIDYHRERSAFWINDFLDMIDPNAFSNNAVEVETHWPVISWRVVPVFPSLSFSVAINDCFLFRITAAPTVCARMSD